MYDCISVCACTHVPACVYQRGEHIVQQAASINQQHSFPNPFSVNTTQVLRPCPCPTSILEPRFNYPSVKKALRIQSGPHHGSRHVVFIIHPSVDLCAPTAYNSYGWYVNNPPSGNRPGVLKAVVSLSILKLLFFPFQWKRYRPPTSGEPQDKNNRPVLDRHTYTRGRAHAAHTRVTRRTRIYIHTDTTHAHRRRRKHTHTHTRSHAHTEENIVRMFSLCPDCLSGAERRLLSVSEISHRDIHGAGC